MSLPNRIVNGQMDALTFSRFMGRTLVVRDCWVWTGHVTAEGYGVMRVGQKRVAAHRIAYEHFVGPIPDGLVLDHLCRNRPCVNPEHLEAVPNAENVDRGVGITAVNSRKTHCKRGHEFTPENTRVTPKGKRECRTCHRENLARLKAAKEDSMPDLPTAPYTVIRPHWRKKNRPRLPLMLSTGNDPGGPLEWDGLDPDTQVQALITGFEVLAVPINQSPDAEWYRDHAIEHDKRVRRETVKAVIARVREVNSIHSTAYGWMRLADIEKEFTA